MSRNFPNLPRTTKFLRQFGSDGVALVRQVLVKNGKKATGFTAASIEYEFELITGPGEYSPTVAFYSDEAMFFIQDGRPAGSKFPPSIFSKQGMRLNLWFGAKGIPKTKSTDFLVRRKIARDGIEPKPVIDMSYEEVKAKFNIDGLYDAFYDDIFEWSYDLLNNAING